MQSVARKAAREGQYDSRVDTAVSYVNRADATVPEVTHLINTAMNTCLTIAWHSSYPWSTTQSERRWGDSMVVLMDEAGNFIYGKLRLALTHSKRWPAGKRLLGFLQRTEHTLARAECYEYLLALAKHEVPLHESSGMLVQ